MSHGNTHTVFTPTIYVYDLHTWKCTHVVLLFKIASIHFHYSDITFTISYSANMYLEQTVTQ